LYEDQAAELEARELKPIESACSGFDRVSGSALPLEKPGLAAADRAGGNFIRIFE
jgi:hypothetical protein